MLDYSDAGAHSKAFLHDGSVVVEYNLDPWFLDADSARTVFLFHAKQHIPLLFKRMASASAVVVAASLEFSDIRGHHLRGRALEIKFTRINADQVNWRYVRKRTYPEQPTHTGNIRAFGESDEICGRPLRALSGVV